MDQTTLPCNKPDALQIKFCILCYKDCTPLLHSVTLVLGVGGSLGQTESSIMGKEECGRAQVL